MINSSLSPSAFGEGERGRSAKCHAKKGEDKKSTKTNITASLMIKKLSSCRSRATAETQKRGAEVLSPEIHENSK
jgi:hypothetical protein